MYIKNQKQCKYAIRKTTLGVGSVLIGVMLFGTNISAEAAENTSSIASTSNIRERSIESPSSVPVEEISTETVEDQS
ncbi:YSIRK-type signal peptide-containing protein [Enterococcus faecium]|uniref:YSIRK-type signal peptide-containing protein n=1 Tax=Enterococcus faecium TaxID=1352 RepID=UPI0009851949|nr:YSIRK-type signal peptide-containing protein [Enterococcus faecium]OOG24496.1 hypothetical protein BZK37_14750 [Enterococcus casseliflavus]MCE3180604.1 YSIRK-type signal peptide-containing protein [Enterococcus faecium]MCE3185958.1 YSIRK-type signal peptide-containing protein [Enterococcus faecium]MCU2106422.1 YSIRK-type signal peptide-containing protein [Enterococcus faecium]MCU2187512.1 YSIRK-type signal peptide-containing protein [Enterococcus faecium]